MALKDRFKNLNSGRVMVIMVGFICVFLLAAAMKLMAPILIPFAVALLLSFIFDPIVSALERIRLPRPLGIAIVVILIGVGFYLIGLLLFVSIKRLIGLYPRYELRFTIIYEQVAQLLDLPYDDKISLLSNLFGQLGFRQKVQSFALGLSNESISILGNLAIVLIFMVFLMLERSHFKDKILAAFEGRVSDKIRKIASTIMVQIVRYLSVKFLISAITGILAFVLYTSVGLEFALIWGAIAFALNFIPNIGSILAGVGATVFALVQFWPNPVPILIVAIGILLINQILGNFVEPRVVGESLDLSPFIVLFSLGVWGWLWGFMGLVLAVPLTVVVKIICENIPILEPVSTIMGSYKALKERKSPDRIKEVE